MKETRNLPERKTLRRKLRHQVTAAERLLWRSLKNSGVGTKVRGQHGAGPYEIQGGIHDDVLRSEYDAQRLTYLESQSIRVRLFENRELGSFALRCLNNHPVCGNKDAVFF